MNEDDIQKFQDEITIDIPPKEGAVLSVIFTWDLDMRSHFPYLYPNGHGPDMKQDDWGHPLEWYLEKVEHSLQQNAPFCMLPSQSHKGWWVYLSTEYLRTKLKHIHLAWTESPLAKREMGGERIAVARELPLPLHGPGKRRHN